MNYPEDNYLRLESATGSQYEKVLAATITGLLIFMAACGNRESSCESSSTMMCSPLLSCRRLQPLHDRTRAPNHGNSSFDM